MGKKSYKDLEVWKKAVHFADRIFDVTDCFPSKHFRLVSQMTDAAVSIPSNIAEGCGRNSYADNLRFLSYARGSISEIETQIIISHRRKFIDDITFQSLSKDLDEISRMLSGLKRSILDIKESGLREEYEDFEYEAIPRLKTNNS